MPCDDITEYLTVNLDQADRLTDFSLQKNTCGATVGHQQLMPYVLGKSVDELLSASAEALIADLEDKRRIEHFVLHKQLFAVQAALEVYTGAEAGGIDELFAVERIAYHDEGVRITGLVSVAVVAAKVEACKSCRCG
ncbi:MAG: hypothetical protein H6707_07265 [Deltaproteobacteria bacterium]|nr:hypothetical protein [Deltaproteobacteria bacterium]